MDKGHKQLISTHVEYGTNTHVVSVFRNSDGHLETEIRDVNNTTVYAHGYIRNTAPGIIKKTDNGIFLCLEKLTGELPENERTRYIRQLVAHDISFKKDYIEKYCKDQMTDEEIKAVIYEKYTNIFDKFMTKYPNVDLASLLEELVQNEIVLNNKGLTIVLQQQLENIKANQEMEVLEETIKEQAVELEDEERE